MKKRRRRPPLHPDFFGLPPPPSPGARNTDPETSHRAARRASSVRAIDRALVLEAHANHPEGLTDFELGDLVRRQQTSAGKRRGELRDMGYIEHAGFTRPAPSGSPAIVWRITFAGKLACPYKREAAA